MLFGIAITTSSTNVDLLKHMILIVHYCLNQKDTLSFVNIFILEITI